MTALSETADQAEEAPAATPQEIRQSTYSLW